MSLITRTGTDLPADKGTLTGDVFSGRIAVEPDGDSPDARTGSFSQAEQQVPTVVSVIIPAFNEAENLIEVLPETVAVLEETGLEYEIIVIDDGSKDATRSVLRGFESTHDRIRSLRHRRNLGKAAAISNGFQAALGDFIVMMDADGQDDPAEIPKLMEKMTEDVGLVGGHRQARKDRLVKRWTSKIYNKVTSMVTGVKGTDFNSGLKVVSKEAAQSVRIYGELHRYIPILIAWEGFLIEEVEVNHRPRLHGTTKYGIARFWRGLFDLITVRYLRSYRRRPFHFFGGIGLLSLIAGGGLLTWMMVLHFESQKVGTRPALIAGVLLVVIAVQLISFGLLGELIVYLSRRVDRREVVESEIQARS